MLTGGVAAEPRSWLGGSGGGAMTSGISVVTAWAGAASASNSFTITDAVVIFVVAVVLLMVGVGLARGGPGCWSPAPAAVLAQPGGCAGPPSRMSRRSSGMPGCTAGTGASGKFRAARKENDDL